MGIKRAYLVENRSLGGYVYGVNRRISRVIQRAPFFFFISPVQRDRYRFHCYLFDKCVEMRNSLYTEKKKRLGVCVYMAIDFFFLVVPRTQEDILRFQEIVQSRPAGQSIVQSSRANGRSKKKIK